MPVKAKLSSGSDDPYLELIMNVHPLRPIRSDEEHQRAKRALRGLAGDKRPEAIDFQNVLLSIIEAYERQLKHQIDTSHVTAAHVVRHLLADRNMSVSAFARERGIAPSTLSDMLNGKRAWSTAVIVKVADHFGLNRGLFLK